MQIPDLKRVLLAGLAAGLVLELADAAFAMLWFAQPIEDALIEAGGRMPNTPGLMLQSLLVALLLGVVIVWLHTLLLTRTGSSWRAALNAGLAVWFLSSFVPGHGLLLAALFPPTLVFAAIAWGLTAALCAAFTGGWLYRCVD